MLPESSDALNKKPAGFSEILVPTYQATSCHIIAAHLHHIFKVNQLCMLKFLPIFSIIIAFSVRLLLLYLVIIKASLITFFLHITSCKIYEDFVS
jgi:hypothetical protein